MNEASAIRLCLASGDPRGFEFLVKQYGREAYFHALGFVGDSSTAEDMCQESFAKAYANIPRLKTLGAFYPWFYIILRNTCFNHLRSLKPQAPDHELLDFSTDPISLVQGGDEREIVWETLGCLKPEFREILIFKHLQDKSYADISNILQIPRGTVMSRLYHARKAFRITYQQLEENKHGLRTLP